MNDTQSLAGEIRDARKKQGLTQQQLADQSGVSLRMIQDAEGGKRRPQPANLAAIRRVLVLDATAEDTRASWDGYTTAVLDIIGATLATFEPEERRQLVFELTNFVFEKRHEVLSRREAEARH